MDSEYTTYLKSKKWRRKRLVIFRRDNGACLCCESRKRLQVHHLTYARIYREDYTDLITVCDTCHQAIERLIESKRITRIGRPSELLRMTFSVMGLQCVRLGPVVSGRVRRKKVKADKPETVAEIKSRQERERILADLKRRQALFKPTRRNRR